MTTAFFVAQLRKSPPQVQLVIRWGEGVDRIDGKHRIYLGLPFDRIAVPSSWAQRDGERGENILLHLVSQP